MFVGLAIVLAWRPTTFAMLISVLADRIGIAELAHTPLAYQLGIPKIETRID
jgi:hypothetical protein